MNWLRLSMKISVVLFAAWMLTACGVKGDPLPPEKPSELGRGRPTYRRATEKIKVEHKRRTDDDEEEKESDDEERD